MSGGLGGDDEHGGVIRTGSWCLWRDAVPVLEIPTSDCSRATTVVPTVDTLRHVEVIKSCLEQHRPIVLCGPPGSGKTMTLTSTLRAMAADSGGGGGSSDDGDGDYEDYDHTRGEGRGSDDGEGKLRLKLVSLDFSSATTPELVLKALAQHCTLQQERGGGGGLVMSPSEDEGSGNDNGADGSNSSGGGGDGGGGSSSGNGRWLVVFCDEVNLPAEDAYGTMRVVSFMRQLCEHGGFWRDAKGRVANSSSSGSGGSDGGSSSSGGGRHVWVSVRRVQFVGACNPPTDPGRNPISQRFLRHATVVLVDFPSPTSLKQIYGTYTRALLRGAGSTEKTGSASLAKGKGNGSSSRRSGKGSGGLRGFARPLMEAMVEFYLANQRRFRPVLRDSDGDDHDDDHDDDDDDGEYNDERKDDGDDDGDDNREVGRPWFVYSPRELSRWVRALYEGIYGYEESEEGSLASSLSVPSLVRLWLHEGLRLFRDRLCTAKQRRWCDRTINRVALQHFPGIDPERCLRRPVLFSCWVAGEDEDEGDDAFNGKGGDHNDDDEEEDDDDDDDDDDEDDRARRVHRYSSVSQRRLRSFVRRCMRGFNEENPGVRLVAFDAVLEHALRIDR